MYLLYDLLLHTSLIILLPYFLFKMAMMGKYRQGLLERFGVIGDEKVDGLEKVRSIWFHAVSVGETKAVIPLVKKLRERHPEVRIVFSTVTATGNAIAKQEFPWVDALIFSPLDLSWVVKRVVGRLKPRLFVTVEKEIWPNLFRVLHNKGVPIVMVNGTISSRSFKRYRLFAPFFKDVFSMVTLFCAQTSRDGDMALTLGMDKERVVVTGNVKFDGGFLALSPYERIELMKALELSDGERVIVSGSTHRGEEEVVLVVFKRLKEEFRNLRLILAPRHPERFGEVEGLIRGKGFSLLKRSETLKSQLSKSPFYPPFEKGGEGGIYDVILLDTLGELHQVYGLADAVFVGGSLVDVGGHNILEPAFQKRPILFGPYMQNYIEIVRRLLEVKGGMMVKDGEGLWKGFRLFLLEPTMARRYGEAAYKLIEANKGTTERSLEVIEGFL
ncbi:MAG: 3-deoxy-D-manno-octulosonic acid transferase [Deltaproteobacteria bacterium]|nr:3-deoxy-D-manno-octulosonic acid transferase [Deltaproteobacteria bacterium]